MSIAPGKIFELPANLLAAGWAPGWEWLFIDVALLAADFALYRVAAKPQARV